MDKVVEIVVGTSIAIIIFLGLALVFNFPILWLWNSTMPILGLPELTFWQMFRLLALMTVLVKGSGGSSSKS